jgi:hypothetical protein
VRAGWQSAVCGLVCDCFMICEREDFSSGNYSKEKGDLPFGANFLVRLVLTSSRKEREAKEKYKLLCASTINLLKCMREISPHSFENERASENFHAFKMKNA